MFVGNFTRLVSATTIPQGRRTSRKENPIQQHRPYSSSVKPEGPAADVDTELAAGLIVVFCLGLSIILGAFVASVVKS